MAFEAGLAKTLVPARQNPEYTQREAICWSPYGVFQHQYLLEPFRGCSLLTDFTDRPVVIDYQIDRTAMIDREKFARGIGSF
jgi:hypothetical protein